MLEKINETLGEHHGKRLVSLYSVLGDEKFKEAVEACFETNKKEELEEQGLEDVVFVLYLCWRYVRASRGKPVQNGDKEWIKRLEGVYGTPEDVENKMKANAGEDEDEEDEDVGGVGEIYDAVFPAAAEEAEDVFGGKEWTKGLLAWGMRVYREEGVGIVGVRVEPEEEGGWVEEEPEEEESVYVVEIRG